MKTSSQRYVRTLFLSLCLFVFPIQSSSATVSATVTEGDLRKLCERLVDGLCSSHTFFAPGVPNGRLTAEQRDKIQRILASGADPAADSTLQQIRVLCGPLIQPLRVVNWEQIFSALSCEDGQLDFAAFIPQNDYLRFRLALEVVYMIDMLYKQGGAFATNGYVELPGDFLHKKVAWSCGNKLIQRSRDEFDQLRAACANFVLEATIDGPANLVSVISPEEQEMHHYLMESVLRVVAPVVVKSLLNASSYEGALQQMSELGRIVRLFMLGKDIFKSRTDSASALRMNGLVVGTTVWRDFNCSMAEFREFFMLCKRAEEWSQRPSELVSESDYSLAALAHVLGYVDGRCDFRQGAVLLSQARAARDRDPRMRGYTLGQQREAGLLLIFRIADLQRRSAKELLGLSRPAAIALRSTLTNGAIASQDYSGATGKLVSTITQLPDTPELACWEVILGSILDTSDTKMMESCKKRLEQAAAQGDYKFIGRIVDIAFGRPKADMGLLRACAGVSAQARFFVMEKERLDACPPPSSISFAEAMSRVSFAPAWPVSGDVKRFVVDPEFRAFMCARLVPERKHEYPRSTQCLKYMIALIDKILDHPDRIAPALWPQLRDDALHESNRRLTPLTPEEFGELSEFAESFSRFCRTRIGLDGVDGRMRARLLETRESLHTLLRDNFETLEYPLATVQGLLTNPVFMRFYNCEFDFSARASPAQRTEVIAHFGSTPTARLETLALFFEGLRMHWSSLKHYSDAQISRLKIMLDSAVGMVLREFFDPKPGQEPDIEAIRELSPIARSTLAMFYCSHYNELVHAVYWNETLRTQIRVRPHLDTDETKTPYSTALREAMKGAFPYLHPVRDEIAQFFAGFLVHPMYDIFAFWFATLWDLCSEQNSNPRNGLGSNLPPHIIEVYDATFTGKCIGPQERHIYWDGTTRAYLLGDAEDAEDAEDDDKWNAIESIELSGTAPFPEGMPLYLQSITASGRNSIGVPGQEEAALKGVALKVTDYPMLNIYGHVFARPLYQHILQSYLRYRGVPKRLPGCNDLRRAFTSSAQGVWRVLPRPFFETALLVRDFTAVEGWRSEGLVGPFLVDAAELPQGNENSLCSSFVPLPFDKRGKKYVHEERTFAPVFVEEDVLLYDFPALFGHVLVSIADIPRYRAAYMCAKESIWFPKGFKEVFAVDPVPSLDAVNGQAWVFPIAALTYRTSEVEDICHDANVLAHELVKWRISEGRNADESESESEGESEDQNEGEPEDLFSIQEIRQSPELTAEHDGLFGGEDFDDAFNHSVVLVCRRVEPRLRTIRLWKKAPFIFNVVLQQALFSARWWPAAIIADTTDDATGDAGQGLKQIYDIVLEWLNSPDSP
ncbi:MAG: hypothetical protein LBF84_03895 [Holosporales bacterium]|nr:hypothetical protein [Holosporales bacterium]